METSEDIRQHLAAEKDNIKKNIIEQLTELYFLRNDGHMCDFHNLSSKERYINLLSNNTSDDDIISDQKFSQILNLKLLDEPPTGSQPTNTTTSISEPTPPVTGKLTSSLTSSSTATSSLSQSAAPNATETDSQTKLTYKRAKLEPEHLTTSAHDATSLVTSKSDSINPPPEKKLREESPIRKQPQQQQLPDVVDSKRPSLSVSAEFIAAKDRLEDTQVSGCDQRTTPDSEATHTARIQQSVSPSRRDDSSAHHQTPKLSDSPLTHTAKTTDSQQPRSTTERAKHGVSQSRTTSDEDVHMTPSRSDSINPPTEKRLREESPTRKNLEDSKRLNLSRNDATINDKTEDTQVHDQEHRRGSECETPEVVKIHQSTTSKNEESPTRISKVVEPIVTPSAVSAENQQKLIFERAKHEAAVTSRIAELRKQGLWSAKRLPKLQEPPRPKTHWDYLLEEMRWLSSDFDAERKWKRKAAKKCAQMVYRYHQEKRSKIERAEREHLQHIKKLAASMAKEIRSFWSSVEKIVDFRQQTKLEETRKKAWGVHLNYILDQTSKFSNTCVEDNTSLTAKDEMDIDYLEGQDRGDEFDKEPEKEPVIKVSSLQIYLALAITSSAFVYRLRDHC